MTNNTLAQQETDLQLNHNSEGTNEEILLQNFYSLLEESIALDDEKRFEPLVRYLMNDIYLVAGNSKYRIVECEVYYYDKSNEHADNNTHQREDQLNAGSWYFNDFGLDITIGNKGKKIFGGILIRSLRCLTGDVRYINGPSCILRELFGQLGSIFSRRNALYFEKDSKGLITDKEIYRATRMNLAKEDENFKQKDYRFIAELNSHNKIPGKETLVRQLFKDNKITTDKVKAILGYNLKH